MTTKTSTELLAGLLDQSNVTAWGEFNRRYRPIVVSYARRCGLQEADAEDVAQDTLAEFLEAYRAGKYERSRGSRLSHWFKGIAVNRIREFRRRAARSRECQVAAGDSSTDLLLRVPDDAAEDQWQAEWTAHVLAVCLQAVRGEFDTKTFRAFELYGIRQQPVEDVAKGLGISANAVYIAKSRVLSRIQAISADLDAVLG